MTQTKTTLPDMIPISLAGHRIKKATNGRVAPTSHTVWRWIRYGLRGVRLEAQMCAGQLFVSEGDLLAFMKAVAAQPAVIGKCQALAPKNSTTGPLLKFRVSRNGTGDMRILCDAFAVCFQAVCERFAKRFRATTRVPFFCARARIRPQAFFGTPHVG